MNPWLVVGIIVLTITLFVCAVILHLETESCNELFKPSVEGVLKR